ncbi:MAG: hypothetical protein PHU65_07925, partial [Actinomycetota bacterium]|nr:hypothetical protein [Actinomycetota bacterium]
MARDKKDFDYWDKYYGEKKSSRPPERRSSSGSGRRDYGEYEKSRSSKSKKSKNEQYESKIVGSEYKVKKKKRKSGIPRAITTAILI